MPPLSSPVLGSDRVMLVEVPFVCTPLFKPSISRAVTRTTFSLCRPPQGGSSVRDYVACCKLCKSYTLASYFVILMRCRVALL